MAEPEDDVELVSIEPALPGHEGRGLLMVNGYLSRLSNAALWARAYRDRGYGGAIQALVWETGGPLTRHVTEMGFSSAAKAGSATSALRALPALGKTLTRVPAWGTLTLGGAMFAAVAGNTALRHWRERADAADRVGARLGEQLACGRPAWARDELQLAGFSLGARVVRACLESASPSPDAPVSQATRAEGRASPHGGSAPRFEVERVDLFGGAVDSTLPWERALHCVRGEVFNHFSRADWVLRGACRLLYSAPPIGLRAVEEATITNVDLTNEVTLHWSYPDALERIAGVPDERT